MRLQLTHTRVHLLHTLKQVDKTHARTVLHNIPIVLTSCNPLNGTGPNLVVRKSFFSGKGVALQIPK